MDRSLHPVSGWAASTTPEAPRVGWSFKNQVTRRTGSHASNAGVAQVSIGSTDLLIDWEDRIGQILGDDTKVEEKANKLLKLFPHLPEAGQVEAANHTSNLLPDEGDEQFDGYLKSANTPASV
jgi:hypothetical protein